MQDPKSLIKRLIKAGMTETEIADELRDEGIDVTQPTINRIASGTIRKTSFDIGMGLIKLHERRIAQQQRA